MTVRSDVRHGRRVWIIDIRYVENGTKKRFRNYAEVQTLVAARAEDRRRMGLVATTGIPFERVATVAPTSNTAGVVPEARPRFEDVAREYLRVFGPSHLKPSTLAGYTKVIEGHLIPAFGEMTPDAIDAAAVRRLDVELADEKRRPSTRRNVQAVLRSVLCRYAVEAGILEMPPRLPRLPRVGATISATLSPDEIRALLAVSAPGERIAFMLGAYAGLRAGEVRGLRWRDVNLPGAVLVVRRSLCNGTSAAPKSGHERLVPLVSELKAALEAIDGHPLDGPVTRGPRKPWSDTSLNKAFGRATARANIGHWRLHDLRHFYVTTLFRARLPAPVVQRLAGHEHLATTQRYAHLVDVDLAHVARELERVARGAGGEPQLPDGSKR